jgi:hypothetical protein
VNLACVAQAKLRFDEEVGQKDHFQMETREGRVKPMSMPRDSFQINIQNNVMESWRDHLSSMEKSLDILEKGLNEAEEMTQ